MIKQKTSNTFSGGLALDYNPINSEEKTLSNCLNGTFITNDGDELLLQNDMGNARVFQIKLDNGYVPVGVCEHGGVTYIASYNPITDKGQVGSFPSPQETFFSESWGGETSGTACSIGYNGSSSLPTLEYTQQIFPTDQIIRPGDKFDIFVKDETYYKKELISNTDNVTNDKPTSPKNKALTLSVCVADSSGNLHDITPTLKRFKVGTNTEIPFDEDSLLKQNTGTIFQKYPDTQNSGSEVDKYQVELKNIYNYKISGSLFLVYRANSLDSVEVTAEFFKGPMSNLSKYVNSTSDSINLEGNANTVKENELAVAFDVIYRYNCPDGFFGINDEVRLDETGTYHCLDGIREDFDPENVIHGIAVDIYKKTNSGLWQVNPEKRALPFRIDNTSENISTPVYNFDTNLYTSRQRYLMKGISLDRISELKLNLLPSIIYGDIDFLGQEILIDVEKLNSGEVSISQWKYFVDNNEIRLTLGLEAYPYDGTRLTDVKILFYKITDTSLNLEKPYEVVLPQKMSYHGNNNVVLSFDDFFERRNIYCAIISYKLTKSEQNDNTDSEVFYAGARTLLTTRLYNEMYLDSSVTDFNNELDKSTNTLHDFNLNLVIENQEVSDNSTYTTSGNVINPSADENGVASVVKTKKVDITRKLSAYMNQSNKDLYPFDISEEEYKFDNARISNDQIISSGVLNVEGESTYKNQIINDIISKTLTISNENGTVNISGDLISKLIGSTTRRDINLYNAITQYFPKFSKDATSYEKDQNLKLFGFYESYDEYYIAYGITWRALTGPDDHHAVKYIEVDLSKGSEENKNTMTDLHSKVYGDSWNYPEVMKARDGKVTFYITDFVSNYNFLRHIKDRTFVQFITKGSDEEYPDLFADSPNNYNKKNVSLWVSLSRNGDTYKDHVIRKLGPNLLFWKYNGKLYLVLGEETDHTSFNAHDLQYWLKNIYIRNDDEIEYKNANIISNDAGYNLPYKATVNFSFDLTPSYKSYLSKGRDDYMTNTRRNLGEVLREFQLSELYELLMAEVNYSFDTGIQEVSSTVIIDVDGTDDIKDTIAQLNNGSYNGTILLDSEQNIHTADNLGNPLLVNKAYEVVNGIVYNFGDYDILNRLYFKNTLEVQDNKLVPKRFTQVSYTLLKGGSGDNLTYLTTNVQPAILLMKQE